MDLHTPGHEGFSNAKTGITPFVGCLKDLNVQKLAVGSECTKTGSQGQDANTKNPNCILDLSRFLKGLSKASKYSHNYIEYSEIAFKGPNKLTAS